MSTTTVRRLDLRPFSTSQRARSYILSILGLAIIWELLGRFVVRSDLVFAPLSSILLKLAEMAATGELWRNMAASGSAFLIGYAAATILGVALGLLISLRPRVGLYVEPWLIGLYATPMIALAPIFVVVMGIGIYSKIAIIFIEVFFPITVNAALGVRSTSPELIDASRSFGASQRQVIRTVLLPSSLPLIVAGMRIGVARGLAGVVISEIFGSVSGIGNMIWFSAESYDMPRLFSGVFVLAATSMILVSLLSRLEGAVAPWRS